MNRHYSSAGSSASRSWQFNYSGNKTRQLQFPGENPDVAILVVDADQTRLSFSSADGVNYWSDTDVVTRLERIQSGWRVIDKNDRLEEFDTLGRLVFVQTRSGHFHRYTYSDAAVSVVDNFGRKLSIVLNLQGLSLIHI